jgi:hypothetical protein
MRQAGGAFCVDPDRTRSFFITGGFGPVENVSSQ